MLIGFVGDVHGRIYHMLAALATYQDKAGRRFDLVIQVGDMGAYPRDETMDRATTVYSQLDSAERDFARFLGEETHASDCLQWFRGEFSRPIHFINGNHEDLPWLRSLLGSSASWVDIDSLHFLRYVRNGSVLDFNGLQVAFHGWEKDELHDGECCQEPSFNRLMSLPAGSCDVLVTHEAPYGVSTGRDGRAQGSRRISALLASLQPRFHVFGHLHHVNGPHILRTTTSLGLASLAASARWHPDATGLQPGCIAFLDTETEDLAPVTDPWLEAFPKALDFNEWCASRVSGAPRII